MKYFLWVKMIDCDALRHADRPVSRLPACRRHPPPEERAGLRACGELNEVDDPQTPGECSVLPICAGAIRARRSAAAAPARLRPRQRLSAPGGRAAAAPDVRHRVLQPASRTEQHRGRFFKKPDAKDLARVEDCRRAVASDCARVSSPNRKSCPATKPTGCIAGATRTTAICSMSASFSDWN